MKPSQPPTIQNFQHRQNMPSVQRAKKPHQEPTKYQEAPTFYKSDSDWDFGSTSRTNTIDMSAWNYSKSVQEQIKLEEIATVLTNSQSHSPHCRSTDFFGVETLQRMKTPTVGKYSPELTPKLLPEIKHDISSQKTREGNGHLFTFSRSSKRNQSQPNPKNPSR